MAAKFSLGFVTKHNFAKWLKSQSLRASVGRPRTPSSCPIATFIDRATPPGWTVSVGMDGTQVYDKAKHVVAAKVNPTWARSFIAKVDRMSGNVTAAEARCILEG